jgi:hypothetical protein
MTLLKFWFWMATAFSVGMTIGPFLLLPFVPKELRKDALLIILRPWKKPTRMFPPEDGKK